jgi:hypothetical protein
MMISRRNILIRTALLGAALTSPALILTKQALAKETRSANKKTIDNWMDKVPPARSPTASLNVSRFADSIYFLTQAIGWQPDNPAQSTFEKVTVPKGFVTDFASIPSIFWSVLPPDGRYVYPAIIHDYLYWTQDRPRKEADQILQIGMEEFDVGRATRIAIYNAVRSFGGSAWKENRRLQEQGERRVLVKFPSDPRVNWTDWKKDDTVFA